MEKQPKSYKEAEQELEEILRDLEAEEIDVDEIASKVKRAHSLVEFCKKKIQKAQLEIKKIEALTQQEEAKGKDSDPEKLLFEGEET